MSKYEALLQTIKVLTGIIASLSMRHYPPHGTIRELERQLSVAISGLTN